MASLIQAIKALGPRIKLQRTMKMDTAVERIAGRIASATTNCWPCSPRCST